MVSDDAQRKARRRRYRAARKYRPDEIKLMLVAVAPPSALDRYFYFTDVRAQDSLFGYVARTLLGVDPTRANKAQLLGRLQRRGVFLIDLKLDPVDGSQLADAVPSLIRRIRRLRPAKVILIKATVYDAAYHALAEAGLPVVADGLSP